LSPVVFSFLLIFLVLSDVQAQVVVEEFEIEGLVAPTDPETSKAELEKKLGVKVVGFNLKGTRSGWPTMRVELDPKKVTRAQVEAAVAATGDAKKKNFKVHKGPPFPTAKLLEEEQKAIAMLGPVAEEVPKLKNPIPSSKESIGRGKARFEKSCATCHGLDGNGYGPAAQSITTPVRPLSIWKNADASADGYLFWFITNGRTDMPAWGVVLSEKERWDLINYIKTLEAPKKK
jgi:mono/diheme cytochrome c family protein